MIKSFTFNVYIYLIDLLNLYNFIIIFTSFPNTSCDVPKGICLLSFHKFCIHMHN